jgi:Thymosin beta-4 family
MLAHYALRTTEDVAAEKAHQSFLNGVEGFDKSSMNHAETTEKNPLPPMEGLYASQEGERREFSLKHDYF